MSGPSKRPDWGLDLDPTASFELCTCGSGYVVIGTLCGKCEYKARLVELRKFYPPDEAEVRAIVEREYLARQINARVEREVILPRTTIEPRLVLTASEPRYFAGKVLQVWEATARTGDEIAVWLLVGPDPWQMCPAEQIGGTDGALTYYRMTP